MILYFQHKERTSGSINLIRCFLQTSPSTRQRICCLKSWDNEYVVKAIRAVCNKEMACLAASKKYNVPLSILCDYVHSNSDPSQAIQLASQNTVPNTFSVVKEAASKKWFKRFKKRHSDKLSLRQPTEISIARIQQGKNVQEHRRSNSYVTTACRTKWI